MCTNYAPIYRQVLRDIFGVEPPAAEWKAETWQDYAAPIVRVDPNGRRNSILGTFGLTPIN
ncbi:hypothetical protein [Cupriavidus necator]|uniref:hypothetical protein n=1 Tax=Cupriavidus necator TaxID=106590 RepID=UPI0005B36683|nr:hypothetical protein [Cupriavidus necator]